MLTTAERNAHYIFWTDVKIKMKYIIYDRRDLICKYIMGVSRKTRRGVRGKSPRYFLNIRGKSGSAVNRGFVWFTLCMFSPIWGKGNGRGISGFAVNWDAVNRGFSVLRNIVRQKIKLI